MSCCSERIKIQRLQVMSHAEVLTSQVACLTNTVMAVVKKTHPNYGDYYDGMSHDEAKEKGLHIYVKLDPKKIKSKTKNAKRK